MADYIAHLRAPSSFSALHRRLLETIPEHYKPTAVHSLTIGNHTIFRSGQTSSTTDCGSILLQKMPAISPDFDDRQLRSELAERGLAYSLKADITLGNGFTVNLAGFSHRPEDTRTACFAAVPPNGDSTEIVRKSAGLGAPLVFVGSGLRWEVWYQNERLGPQLWWGPQHGTIKQFLRKNRRVLEPRAIFRAKTLARLDENAQLDFVDFASFQRIEQSAGQFITGLIHRMVEETREALGWPHKLNQERAQWIARANFWLLAGRILHDKGVPGFQRGFDLTGIQDVFTRVRKHYADDSLPSQEPKNRIAALMHAARILKAGPALAIVSPETLADPFENALITKETRKESGTHSTPGWLVEYMLGRLRPWIEELAAAGRCRVFEPASGHAPFLLGAMRTLASLPCCDGLDDPARHAFFKKNLEGCEYDGFAREVARLSLTLADVPNPNGWNLGGKNNDDLFHNQRLERGVKNADVVLCNPPFEGDKTAAAGGEDRARVKKAAEILRRAISVAKPGAVFGFIVPQTMLDSDKVTDLRRSLTRDFEWLEICRLPDGIFEKADVETALLLGRRHPAGELKLTVGPTSFRHVLDGDRYRTAFRQQREPTTDQPLPLIRVAPAPTHSLWVPDMLDLWDALASLPKLRDIATPGHGFVFRSEDDALFPRDETQLSDKARKGYEPGFFNVDTTSDTHVLPPTVLLNRNRNAILRFRAGYASGIRQVVMNYAPVRRGPWRNQAFIDLKGHPASSRFVILRPLNHAISELVLWALVNSPICNAYTASHCDKRQILASKLGGLPCPIPTEKQVTRVEAAARAYREAVTRWTATHAPSEKGKVNPRKQKTTSRDTTAPLPGIIPDPDAEQYQLLKLKYLHWRMDAEVLALYNLPAKLERRLLDYFTGERRVGVPFEQMEYFPKGFEGAERLSELLAITADWPKHARREAKLIQKEYDDDGLPPKELEELERLQRLGALHLRRVAPLDRSELDAEIARLQREGKWTE